MVRAFLRNYAGSDRFPVLKAGIIPSLQEARRSGKGPAGFRKDGSYYIFTDVFGQEVCVGYDPLQVARALRDSWMPQAVD